jgi:hypothetical protein
MGVEMRGNYVFVERGEPAFEVASNFTNYIELGSPGGSGHYLEARMQNGQPTITADLRDSSGALVCRVVDSFPQSGSCRREMTPAGWRVLDAEGNLLLAVEAKENICYIRGVLHDSDGTKVAEGTGDTLLIYRGPAVIGKAGNARGIVLG